MFQVRIHCGGYRESFVLSRGIVQPNGDIEPGPGRRFETEAKAQQAGENSVCVNQMGWPFEVEPLATGD